MTKQMKYGGLIAVTQNGFVKHSLHIASYKRKVFSYKEVMRQARGAWGMHALDTKECINIFLRMLADATPRVSDEKMLTIFVSNVCTLTRINFWMCVFDMDNGVIEFKPANREQYMAAIELMPKLKEAA